MHKLMSIKRKCPRCGVQQEIVVPILGYRRWMEDNIAIQYAMPELSADDREVLKTGLCSNCWQKIFQ